MRKTDLSRDLEQVTVKTMVDVVEIRLREYLKKNAVKPGDALPHELDIAKALDVSRNVVREALSRLRMLGMVQSRRKRGMVLANPDILVAMERVLDPLILDAVTLKNIFELRLVLEMGLADLLYLRKTEKDIRELEVIAKSEVNRTEKPFNIEYEIAFHGKLYRITKNETFIRFQNMLLPVFEYVLDYEIKTNGKNESGKVTHADLVEILKSGSSEDFRRGMKEHLKPHFQRFR